jgi:hypothetical protein
MTKLFIAVGIAALFIGCFFSKRSNKIPLFIDVSTWKSDTCGMWYKRYDIALKIIAHKNNIIGIKSQEVVKIFGKPDFVYKSPLFKYPDAIEYKYSTSSAEVINGKCGDPITHSLAFIIRGKSQKVVDIRESIH